MMLSKALGLGIAGGLGLLLGVPMAEAGCTRCDADRLCAAGSRCTYQETWNEACCVRGSDAEVPDAEVPDRGFASCPACRLSTDCAALGAEWSCSDACCRLLEPACQQPCGTSSDCSELGDGYACDPQARCCVPSDGSDAGDQAADIGRAPTMGNGLGVAGRSRDQSRGGCSCHAAPELEARAGGLTLALVLAVSAGAARRRGRVA